MLPDDIPLSPKDVPKSAMRAISRILVQGGWDLEERLRSAASDLAATDDDVGVTAFCHLLADLVHHGWTTEPDGDRIRVAAPLALHAVEGERLDTLKRRRREYNARPRQRQLADSAVRDFLRKMETPRLFRGLRVSIRDVIDDGHSLATALADADRLPPPERRVALEALIQPTIQVASAKDRCAHTGLPLLEIWRYFRHTWSMGYRPTPGRSLYLLVRNAARPNEPVIGIASLANATLQQGDRDRWIGWHVDSVRQQLTARPERWPEYRACFLKVLEDARAEIRDDDLLRRLRGARGESLEQGLRGIAADASNAREKEQQERHRRIKSGDDVGSQRKLPTTKSGEIDWRAASESPLYEAKRAETLADLLFATRILSKIPEDEPAVMTRVLHDEDLERAITIAAREVRKVGLASRLLEVNICGAVPPYRDLLGGKLVAVAVASNEVSRALEERYGDQVSEIASQMAGRPITRDPSVCVLMTTSLYGKSSQYNRIRLDLGDHGLLRWVEIGETEGRGTSHLSNETIAALRALSVHKNKGRLINNLFGEGQSPLMRQVRDGLARLGLPAQDLLQHGVKRMMYGLELFEGAKGHLQLNKPRERQLAPLAVIASAWRDRWLSARIGRREVLDRVSLEGPETVRAELAAPEGPQQSLFPAARRPHEPEEPSKPSLRIVVMTKQSKPDLVKGLYRSLGACADHHDPSLVKDLHIPTPLDDFVRERAPGRVVFVTGNPGDGKTHLLKHLDAELKAAKVDVVYDANERTEDDIIASVDHALERRGRGLAVAINEGVLHQVIHSAPKGKAWVAEVERQLLHPLCYRDGEAPASDRVLVLDLNMRNNLTVDVLRRALEGIVRMSAACKGCPKATCDLQRNTARLGEVPVSRLAALLQRCAANGSHATMRDVQGFLSYLVWGPRSCDDVRTARGAASRYWDNAFEGGSGPLFDAVRRHDPRSRTMPLLDHALWRGEDLPEHWSGSSDDLGVHNGTTLDERLRWFTSRKRRALFEHRDGDALLRGAADPVDTAFEEIMRGGTSAVRRLARMLNRFFGSSAGGETLRMWCTHRYDARPSRYAAAVARVPAEMLEILRPRPRPEVAEAFPDYRPDHCVLIRRGQSDLARGLRVDRALVEALHAAESGLSPSFRLGEPEARIAGFLDKLSKDAFRDDDEVDVMIVDRDLGDEARYTIGVTSRRYLPTR